MSLIVMQTAIARLCVDIDFRQAFLKDPGSTLAPLDLTAEEIESIKALDMVEIRDYAASLLGKKIALLKKWLDMSITFLEVNLGEDKVRQILRRYGLENIRDTEELGGEWVRSECDRVTSYFRELIQTKEIEVHGFSDLLEFEAVSFAMALDPEVAASAVEFTDANTGGGLNFDEDFLNAARPLLGKHVRVQLYDYDVAEFSTQFEQGMRNAALRFEPVGILFFKKAQDIKLQTSIINGPLKDLLDMCDGKRTTKEILSAIASQYGSSVEGGPEEVIADCVDIFEQLYTAGAVRFDRCISVAASMTADSPEFKIAGGHRPPLQ
jgi:hypothetical protein